MKNKMIQMTPENTKPVFVVICGHDDDYHVLQVYDFHWMARIHRAIFRLLTGKSVAIAPGRSSKA